MNSDELRETFHRVNAYRAVTTAVRGSAGHSLFSGVFFCVIAGMVYNDNKPVSSFVLLYAFLGILEIGVGLWKRIAPSVECLLVDGILNLCFAVSIFARQALAFNAGGNVNLFSIGVGVYVLFGAYKSFSAYFTLRKLFVERPTSSQMKYVADMIAEIRGGQPEEDPSMLDFSRELDFKAQMLGELAFLIDRGGEVHVLDKNDLIIDRPTGADLGRVVLFNNPFPPLRIREANWQNYCRWKGVPAS